MKVLSRHKKKDANVIIEHDVIRVQTVEEFVEVLEIVRESETSPTLYDGIGNLIDEVNEAREGFCINPVGLQRHIEMGKRLIDYHCKYHNLVGRVNEHFA